MVKVIAMYFPQFHAIPENNRWWGEGFTDWVNVKKAKPQFEGHYQPRVPLNHHYYDQSDLKTIRWQTDLAQEYGLYGFCHYHYWFEEKRLLHKPTDLLLCNKDIKFPFCLSWANETWSRQWDGQNHRILIRQTHIPEKTRWKKHFDYLIKAWTDERAIKVDGRPIFAIYRPQNIEHLDDMLDFWQEEARRYGLNQGIYFIAQKQYEFHDKSILRRFDAVFQFNPFESIFYKKEAQKTPETQLRKKLKAMVPAPLRLCLRSLLNKLSPKLIFHNYDDVWADLVQMRTEPGITTFPGAFVDWDNTPRYNNRATLFKGCCPERFEYWLGQLIDTMGQRNLPADYIFLNAWNEWGESAYLEPDEKNGYRYLEAVKRAVNRPLAGKRLKNNSLEKEHNV